MFDKSVDLQKAKFSCVVFWMYEHRSWNQGEGKLSPEAGEITSESINIGWCCQKSASAVSEKHSLSNL